MTETIEKYIMDIIPAERIRRNVSMAGYTTFRVGGPAEIFIEVNNEEELSALVSFFYKVSLPYFVLGNGSNLLVSDLGVEGVVLKLSDTFQKIEIDGEKVTAYAGALLTKTAFEAAKQSLSGLEFAAGIPGSVGGAVVMNAGAYDGEMAQVITKVRVMDESGAILEFDADTMEFGYRTSIIKHRPYIVLCAEMKLQKGDEGEIRAKMADFNARRREKQPLEFASAGSTFKRPEGNFAGKLIMDAGLRGYRIGGAQVSEKHCGFLINIGNATAGDISELMDEVREKVKEKFGVELEPEVIRVGVF